MDAAHNPHPANVRAWLACVQDLLATPQVQSMRRWVHHPGVTCYEHSVFVSYVAFRLARRLGRDWRMAARTGLLHDLYLYDPADRAAHPGNQCFDHPVAACRNAEALTPLSGKERNIILSHMWPLAVTLPRSAEALVVNAADKFCATVEVAQLTRLRRVRRLVPGLAMG